MLRKIDGNMSYYFLSGERMSNMLWFSKVLGHSTEGGLDTSISYSNIHIEFKRLHIPEDIRNNIEANNASIESLTNKLEKCRVEGEEKPPLLVEELVEKPLIAPESIKMLLRRGGEDAQTKYNRFLDMVNKLDEAGVDTTDRTQLLGRGDGALV
jgi:hypothetical protein